MTVYGGASEAGLKVRSHPLSPLHLGGQPATRFPAAIHSPRGVYARMVFLPGHLTPTYGGGAVTVAAPAF